MFARLSPWWLWLLLAVPAMPMIPELMSGEVRGVLHGSGEWSARLLLVSLMATPLMYLFKGRAFPRWLVKNRRYFGVAAFAYAALHVVAYMMREGTLAKVLAEATAFDMATGWLAFLIFIPLAATSMDLAVRKMGTWWKWVQRFTYAAAALTLLHWMSLHGWSEPVPALVQFAPLLALTGYRLWWVYLRVRPQAAV
jgi:methionine sulfoxide reductase heme-binding subunit